MDPAVRMASTLKSGPYNCLERLRNQSFQSAVIIALFFGEVNKNVKKVAKLRQSVEKE